MIKSVPSVQGLLCQVHKLTPSCSVLLPRGCHPQVARDIPYAAAQFTVFEALKRRRTRVLERKRKAAGGATPAASTSSSGTGSLTKGEVVLSNLWMGAVSIFLLREHTTGHAECDRNTV